jgi:serine/threonine-protein kinase HipA
MSEYKSLEQIKVGLDFGVEPVKNVGRLAIRDHQIYFQYDDAFLSSKIELSPFHLPLESGLKTFKPTPFEGLPGLFNDSLPDGWGRLIIDRLLRSKNMLPTQFSPLDRLAHVGTTGLGALVFEPDQSEDKDQTNINLDKLAEQTKAVFEGDADEVLNELISLNGSSAGARPKALIGVDGQMRTIIHGKNSLPTGSEHWMVKFANSFDGPDAGTIEYVYSIMARQAGLSMMETHLFPAEKSGGYFATKRFDRFENERLHLHTASGLLHADFRTPTLDYENLIELTLALTKDVRETEKMYRVAAFNVLSHNRDDHSKNFSFIMNKSGEWKFAPAYDLTFSSGPNGEQSTMVMSEGKNPTLHHLIELGQASKIERSKIDMILDQTRNALSQWRSLAIEFGVSKANIDLISKRIN